MHVLTHSDGVVHLTYLVMHEIKYIYYAMHGTCVYIIVGVLINYIVASN